MKDKISLSTISPLNGGSAPTPKDPTIQKIKKEPSDFWKITGEVLKSVADAINPGVPVIGTTEIAVEVADKYPKIIKAEQSMYEQYGTLKDEWGPKNPYYYNLGVQTKDDKSYLERLDNMKKEGN